MYEKYINIVRIIFLQKYNTIRSLSVGSLGSTTYSSAHNMIQDLSGQPSSCKLASGYFIFKEMCRLTRYMRKLVMFLSAGTFSVQGGQGGSPAVRCILPTPFPSPDNPCHRVQQLCRRLCYANASNAIVSMLMKFTREYFAREVVWGRKLPAILSTLYKVVTSGR